MVCHSYRKILFVAFAITLHVLLLCFISSSAKASGDGDGGYSTSDSYSNGGQDGGAQESGVSSSDDADGGGGGGSASGYSDGGGGVSVTGGLSSSLTTCESVRTVTSTGISGGQAGYEATGSVCYNGGGQSFCMDGADYTYLYECAGIQFVDGDAESESNWLDFDAPEDYTKDAVQAYHLQTTRDDVRGRAGLDYALYMNAFDVCRRIDNTSGTQAVYTGVRTEGEWRSNHGVPEGGDATTEGYDHLGDSDVNPPIDVCCGPQYVSICGQVISTGYTTMGTTVDLSSSNGGYAQVECIGNNEYVARAVTGICSDGYSGGYGGGDGDSPTAESGYGYENASTGGRISAEDAARNGVPDGYESVQHNVETNAEGKAAQAEMDKEAKEEELEEQAEEAEEESNSDDDDDDDDNW